MHTLLLFINLAGIVTGIIKGSSYYCCNINRSEGSFLITGILCRVELDETNVGMIASGNLEPICYYGMTANPCPPPPLSLSHECQPALEWGLVMYMSWINRVTLLLCTALVRLSVLSIVIAER